MKRAILLFVIFCSITYSCDKVIVFSQSQPAGIDPLNEFPEVLRGVYIEDTTAGENKDVGNENCIDTLVINTNECTYGSADSTGNSSYVSIELDSQTVIKEYKKLYFLNDDYQLIGIIDRMPNKNLKVKLIYIDEDQEEYNEQIEKLKKITDVTFGSEYSKLFKKDIESIEIDPTPKELMKIIRKGIFIHQLDFTFISK